MHTFFEMVGIATFYEILYVETRNLLYANYYCKCSKKRRTLPYLLYSCHLYM